MLVKNRVEIREVCSKAELRQFVDYPNQLYRDVPQFVPAFYGDDLADWDRSKNPAFEYCEARNFLAWRDGEIVGRIGAILSHKANETWGTNRMRFSQVDFIDDAEVSAALFQTVEDWAREKGCSQVHGPLGFCDMDREGMLVEGFDRRSMFITYYNHPYYCEHMTRLGYEKDVDWVEKIIKVPDKPDEKIARLSEIVQRRYKFKPVELNSKADIKPYVRKAFDLLNEAYANLYGVVPLTERQVQHYAGKFLPLVDRRFVSFVENKEGELIAFGVGAPSLADAFRKCDGKLFPYGWLPVLKALKGKNEAMDLFLVAVRPDLQGTGANAILIDTILRNAIKMGVKYAETGPELETNEKVQSQWKYFEHEDHKRRRCYIKKL